MLFFLSSCDLSWLCATFRRDICCQWQSNAREEMSSGIDPVASFLLGQDADATWTAGAAMPTPTRRPRCFQGTIIMTSPRKRVGPRPATGFKTMTAERNVSSPLPVSGGLRPASEFPLGVGTAFKRCQGGIQACKLRSGVKPGKWDAQERTPTRQSSRYRFRPIVMH